MPGSQNYGYSTLPTRSRGRGRLNYDQMDFGTVGRPMDSRSPCNSRPSTPQPVGGSFRDDNFGRPTSRPHTPSFNRLVVYQFEIFAQNLYLHLLFSF